LNDDVSGELRRLIPFYVAGTLDDSEHRAVEDALTSHPEWQEDIRFWNAAKNHTAIIPEGHPHSELLVDYADGGLRDQPAVVDMIERHLGQCLVCRSDVGRARQVGAAERALPRWRTLAVAAVILAAGAMVLNQLGPEPPRTVAVELAASGSVRSGGTVEPVPVTLTDATDSVALRLGIPLSELADTRFEIKLKRLSDSQTFELVDPVSRKTTDDILWLSIRVARQPYFAVPGPYEILITEDVSGYPDLLPESYALPLFVNETN